MHILLQYIWNKYLQFITPEVIRIECDERFWTLNCDACHLHWHLQDEPVLGSRHSFCHNRLRRWLLTDWNYVGSKIRKFRKIIEGILNEFSCNWFCRYDSTIYQFRLILVSISQLNPVLKTLLNYNKVKHGKKKLWATSVVKWHARLAGSEALVLLTWRFKTIIWPLLTDCLLLTALIFWHIASK